MLWKKMTFLSAAWMMMFIYQFSGTAHAANLRIGTWKTAQTIQPYFYKQFLPANQNIQIFPFTNPADQKVALLAGSLDMCGTTMVHAIHSASRGEPVVVVAALCNKCSALVVRKDGKITDGADLRGKRIGYVPGTMHEILLRETLMRYGLSPQEDVQLVRIDFFDMETALARGSIEAFLSGEPFPTMAVLKGYGRILSYPYYGESVGTINAGLLVTEKTIAAKPDVILNLLRAHAKATQYLNRHPDQWLKKASGFGTPANILQKAAENMELAWRMDDDFVARARALGERMEALGVIDRQPDYHRLFNISFVRKISAETDRQ